MAKTICVDFDGVLHYYTSGWKGTEVIADPPTPGAMEWLAALQQDESLRVAIYSSRSKDPAVSSRCGAGCVIMEPSTGSTWMS